jgi:hypothetical protein
MRALLARNAYNEGMKDTIHVVPNTSGKPLRKVAHARDPQRNLDDIAGTWREDPAFDAALRIKTPLTKR